MKRVTEVSKRLSEIAGQERSALSIDTPTERALAAKFLDKNIKAFKERNAPCCEIKFLKEARKAIHKANMNGKALFVRQIFEDHPDALCLPFCIWRAGNKILLPLEPGFVASFRIYSGGSGLLGHDFEDVAITAIEWEKITAPLTEAHETYSEDFIGNFNPVAFEYMMTKSLGETIGNFEQVVGPKAGTDEDVGGQYGNDILHQVNNEGQQDCINEYQNTRQFLFALQATGLFNPFKIDTDNHSAIIGKPTSDGGVIHKSVLVRGKSGTNWVVDSWYHNNGEPAEIEQLELWRNSYSIKSEERPMPYEYETDEYY